MLLDLAALLALKNTCTCICFQVYLTCIYFILMYDVDVITLCVTTSIHIETPFVQAEHILIVNILLSLRDFNYLKSAFQVN